MENLPDHYSGEPLIYIDKLPDYRPNVCKVTIIMQWELANRLIDFAAPLLKSLERSVTIRRTDEIEREEHRRRNDKAIADMRRKTLRRFYNASKDIPAGISRKEFVDSLCDQPSGNLFYYQRDRVQKAYYRIRNTTARRWKRNGVPTKEIANRFNATEATVRKMLQEKGRP